MLRSTPLRSGALTFALVLPVALVATRPALAQDGAPSKEALTALGEQIAEKVAAADPEAFAVNVDKLVGRALEGIEMSAKTRRDCEAAIKQGVQGLIPQVVQAGSTGLYDLRGTRTVDGGPVLLFRLILAEGGVNYHELAVEANAAGELEVVDLYFYLGGEWISQTFRRNLLGLIAEQEKNFFQRLLGKESAYVKHIRDIQAMNVALQAGKNDRVLAIFAKLPAEVQKHKSVLLVRMQAAQATGDEAYSAALDDIEKHLPDDPAWLLISQDAYILRGQFGKCRESLDRLEARVGEDAFLRFLRGQTLLQESKLDEARKELEKAITLEPDLPGPHLAMVDLAMAAKDWDEVGKRLDACEKNIEGFLLPDTLDGLEGFEEFVKSDAYEAWKKRRGGK